MEKSPQREMIGTEGKVLLDTLRRLHRKKAVDNIIKLVRKTHPADLAWVFRSLNPQEQKDIFQIVAQTEIVAEFLSELDEGIMVELVEGFSPRFLAKVVSNMSPDDAADFLHNQFTNDVKALAVGAAQWNGWCTPKGRLLATFVLARDAGGYLLLLPSAFAEAVAKRLRMFVLRSKVKVEDVSAATPRFGLWDGAMPEGALGSSTATAIHSGWPSPVLGILKVLRSSAGSCNQRGKSVSNQLRPSVQTRR